MKQDRMSLSGEKGREWWNQIAKPAKRYERLGKYAEAFMKLSGVKKGDSVFDMGCGSGTLDLPLADLGVSVFCADYAENMLKSLENVIHEEKLTGLSTCLLAWEDDWKRLSLPVCTMAFASRCMIDVDPYEAIGKLNSVASKRVCLTVPVDAGLFHSKDSPYDLGSQEDMQAYLDRCLGAVKKLGYEPELNYIYDSKGRGEKHWAFISFNK